MKNPYRLCACLVAAWISIETCGAQPLDAETERREAAAGFLLPMSMALTVLRKECRPWLASSADDADEVARSWWQRNRDDLDAAIWITGESLRRYRSSMPPDKALAAERQMLQAMSAAQLNILRGMFKRQLPTPASCGQALQRYKTPLLDVANLGTTKGYEQFGEFGETLKRVRLDKSYRPVDDRHRTFETQVAVAPQPLASLDAIDAAKERRDSAAVVQGFKSLAERADSKAAQSLAMLYLNGEQVARDYPRAAAWFYNAWAMGEPEGINALGVMARDGLGMPVDRKLAIAAFAVAKRAAPNPSDAFQRATVNYGRLAQQLAASELLEAGCMKWDLLDNRFRQLSGSSADRLRDFPKIPPGSLLDSGLFAPLVPASARCAP